MRFTFSPETGFLTVYATQEEFQLAVGKTEAGDHEYQVVKKEIKNKDGSIDDDCLSLLLYEYGDFMAKILESLDITERIRDVIVVSTKARSGFRWKSLYNLDRTGKSNNFFETMFDYALKTLAESNKSSKNNETKPFGELFTERDFAKLTLAQVLLSSLTHPPVFRTRGKASSESAEILAKTKILRGKLDKFEQKYGFVSEDMQKYYSDDKYPEKDMEEWLALYQEYRILTMTSQKFALVEQLVDSWMSSFGDDSL